MPCSGVFHRWEWWQAVPIALVVESVAVNVGYFAHDKQIKGYSALGLRLLSYGIGAGVGAFNFTHNAAHAVTADFAGVFGAASLLSMRQFSHIARRARAIDDLPNP
jgi:hypothetical protein